MSAADRKDPVKNTERIAAEYASKWGAPLRAAYASGTRDVGEFAALWSRYIERPKDTQGAMDYRRSLARRMFPGLIGSVAVGVSLGWVIGAVAGLSALAVLARRKAA